MNDVIKARRKLALEIGDEVKRYVWDNYQTLIDEDPIALLVQTRLPLLYAEAQAEWDALDEKYPDNRPTPTKPSYLERLREALGMEGSLGEILEAAIERI